MKPLYTVPFVALMGAAFLASGCGTMRLMQGMAATSQPNEKILGQLFAVGGGGKADTGTDGVSRITVEHRPQETVWRPAVVMVDQPGELEIVFANRNPQAHLVVVVPSDGQPMALDLPALQSGRAKVHLGTPGMYIFADAIGNHMGRGMMGIIVVGGEVPAHAKLDRPKQRRP